MTSVEPKGSKLELKTLYNVSYSKHEQRWSEYRIASDENLQVKKKQESYAVVDHVERNDESSYIQINNSELKVVLKKLFKGYPKLDVDVAELIFKTPFHPFLHHWDLLVQLNKEEKNPDVAKAIALLIQAVWPSIEPYLDITNRLKLDGVIEFKHLWTIFVPGKFVLLKRGEVVGGGRLLKINPLYAKSDDDRGVKKETDIDKWRLKVEHIYFDGDDLGLFTEIIELESYEGFFPPKDLKCVPLHVLPDEADIMAMLIAKGRKFEALIGSHVKNYDGQKWVSRSGTDVYDLKKYTGRVIIDTCTYNKYQKETLVEQAKEKKREKKSHGVVDENGDGSAFEHLSLKNSARDFPPLTDDECFMASPFVKGFDLENKVWCQFEIDYIQDIEWNDEAFDKLVLPDAEKKITLSLLERQKPQMAKFADSIQDKGKGIILLLCGPPGVGKTLTAESISEKARLSLYSISAGELGGTPVEVDKALKQILGCCHLWNAVLLIDEADVFLETCTTPSTSIERNELISIFLRRLEYYQGFMFLTTNRASAIDKAFESRIDLVIPYEDLDVPARLTVWENFLNPLIPKTAFSPQDFDTLSAYPLNGREIKNAVKLAEIMAAHEGMELGMEHLKGVLDMRKRALKCLAQ